MPGLRRPSRESKPADDRMRRGAVRRPVPQIRLAAGWHRNCVEPPDYKNYRIMDHKVTFGGKPVTLVGNRCTKWRRPPVFTVTDAGLQPVSSDVFHGKRCAFTASPSVDTPVCSLQNIRFNREASKLGDDVVRRVASRSTCRCRRSRRQGIDRVHTISCRLDSGMKWLRDRPCACSAGVVCVVVRRRAVTP